MGRLSSRSETHLETTPLKDELRFAFSRSGGPGGQSVNKVASRVELRWNPSRSRVLSEAEKARITRALASRLTREGDVVIISSVTRSQDQNRSLAFARLEALLAKALRPVKSRRPTKPTRASKERRLASKKKHTEKKHQRGLVLPLPEGE